MAQGCFTWYHSQHLPCIWHCALLKETAFKLKWTTGLRCSSADREYLLDMREAQGFILRL